MNYDVTDELFAALLDMNLAEMIAFVSELTDGVRGLLFDSAIESWSTPCSDACEIQFYSEVLDAINTANASGFRFRQAA